MAKPKTKATMWSQYLGIRAAEMALCMWPLRSNMRFGSGLGRLLCKLDKKHRNRIIQNLQLAMSQLTAKQSEKIA